jgi:hypothetical protein
MLVDKWNDENFAPATEANPDWHPHYATSEKITFDKVSHFLPPNAEKSKRTI